MHVLLHLDLQAMWWRTVHRTFLPALVIAASISILVLSDRVVSFSSEKWFAKVMTPPEPSVRIPERSGDL